MHIVYVLEPLERTYIERYYTTHVITKGQILRASTLAYLLIRRRTFKLPASYLQFESSNQDTTASGFDPTGVRLSTPSDRRCNTSVSAGWSLRRFLLRVCKLAFPDDPQTYTRPSHSLTSSLDGFFRRIVKASILRRIVRLAMLSMAVVPASFAFCFA